LPVFFDLKSTPAGQDEVEQHLKMLATLRNELTLLVNLCTGSKEGCPIIDGISQE